MPWWAVMTGKSRSYLRPIKDRRVSLHNVLVILCEMQISESCSLVLPFVRDPAVVEWRSSTAPALDPPISNRVAPKYQRFGSHFRTKTSKAAYERSSIWYQFLCQSCHCNVFYNLTIVIVFLTCLRWETAIWVYIRTAFQADLRCSLRHSVFRKQSPWSIHLKCLYSILSTTNMSLQLLLHRQPQRLPVQHSACAAICNN